MSFLGVKDVDRVVLAQLDIPALIALNQVNRYYRQLVRRNVLYLRAKKICLRRCTWSNRRDWVYSSGFFKPHYASVNDWINRHANATDPDVLLELQLDDAARLQARREEDWTSFDLARYLQWAALHNRIHCFIYLASLDETLLTVDLFQRACDQGALTTAQWLWNHLKLTLEQVSCYLLKWCTGNNSLSVIQWLISLSETYWCYMNLEHCQPNKAWLWLFDRGLIPHCRDKYVKHCLDKGWYDRLKEYLRHHQYSCSDEQYFYRALEDDNAEAIRFFYEWKPQHYHRLLDLAITRIHLKGNPANKQWLLDLYYGK